MGHSIFGWSLPPGCTMNDIERAYGDQPSFTEEFEIQNKLTSEETELWGRMFELDGGSDELLEKALVWANELGYQAHQCEEAEYQDYKKVIYLTVKVPKLRAYFKNLRQQITGAK